MSRKSTIALIAALLCLHLRAPANAAHMGMGLKIGEVTQHSAIVWTRITKNAERNWDGYRDPKKREPKNPDYIPSPVKVDDREGAMPGAPGQVRLIYSTNKDLTNPLRTDWITVKPENDYIHQFKLTGLNLQTRYYLKVEARDTPFAPASAIVTGSFGTPAPQKKWQDVTFGVVTGQSYWDLDHKQGYHIYPAMQKLNLDFLVPTGDTVYLDSESPRGRTIPLARHHWHRMYSLPRHIEFHKNTPGYWEVDDHDSWANDGWPSLKAKWMNPITFEEGFNIYREQIPMGESTHRTIRWGKGLQIWLVEGRLYRSPNTMPDGPKKTIWGTEQMAWLKKSILASDADFKVLISPTPIVGPDRAKGKNDNHSNKAFAHEGNHFRDWTKENNLTNLFVCCGDRHWQYLSIDPKTKLHEFSCGPVSNEHAGGSPGRDPEIQPFHREKGGFLSVAVQQDNGTPTITFHHRDIHGKIVNEFKQARPAADR